MESDDEEEARSPSGTALTLPKPLAPSSCGAKAGDRKATVWWSKSEANPDLTLPVSHYLVYKYRLDGGSWDNKGSVGEVEAPLTSFTVEFLTNDRTYRFSVVAACGEGKYVSSHSPYSPAVTPSIPLPEPWKQHIDAASGRVYYYNSDTKERSWTRPVKDVFRVDEEVKKKFSEKQLSKYRGQFREVDIDDSGSIDLMELKKLFKLNDLKLSKSALKKLMKEMDVDNDGSIDFNEYMTMIHKVKTGNAASWGLLGLGEKFLAPAMPTRGKVDVEAKHQKVMEEKRRMGKWVVKRDEQTNRDYYFNHDTKESSWKIPAEVLWYLSESLRQKYDDDQVERFKEMFLKYDKDSSGCMDVDELTEALSDLGLKISHAKVLKKIAQFDVDKNGEVDFNEFVTIFDSMRTHPGYLSALRPKPPARLKRSAKDVEAKTDESKSIPLETYEEKCRELKDREEEILQLKEQLSKLEEQLAKRPTKKEKTTIRSFLEQHGLTKYERQLNRQGITQLEQLQRLRIEDYERDLHMKRGHARKCKFALEKLLQGVDEEMRR